MSLIINPYRFTAPVPASGFDTSMLTGRTFVMSRDQSAIYKGNTTTSGLATADGDLVSRIDSGAGPSTIRSFSGAAFMRLRTNRFGSGLDGIVQDDGNFQMSLYNRPAGTAAPGSERPISDLWGAGAKLLIVAGVVHDAFTDVGTPYENDYILAESGFYCGLHVYKSGSNAVLQWYNYPSGITVDTRTVALGAPFVIACRHVSSAISTSLNNGAWSTPVSSGNSGAMAGNAYAFKNEMPDGFDIAAMVTCNNGNTSNTNVAAACTSAGALVGLTI